MLTYMTVKYYIGLKSKREKCVFEDFIKQKVTI